MKQDFEQISRVSGFMHHNGGLYFREISENEYEFKATIKEFHLNKREITHGGFICSLIDAGAGTAVYRNTSGKSCVTISLDIKFISMTKLNDEIKGKVKIIKKTNSMIFVTCELLSQKKLVAQASGIWKVIKKV